MSHQVQTLVLVSVGLPWFFIWHQIFLNSPSTFHLMVSSLHDSYWFGYLTIENSYFLVSSGFQELSWIPLTKKASQQEVFVSKEDQLVGKRGVIIISNAFQWILLLCHLDFTHWYENHNEVIEVYNSICSAIAVMILMPNKAILGKCKFFQAGPFTLLTKAIISFSPSPMVWICNITLEWF